MDGIVAGRDYVLRDDKPVFRPCEPHAVMARLGDKWTVLALSMLLLAPGGRLRSAELKAGLAGISQRMLTLTVRNLERDGLLLRHVFPDVPPRVEYELTERGRSLLPALEGFTNWIRANWPGIEASQRAYDAADAAAGREPRR